MWISTVTSSRIFERIEWTLFVFHLDMPTLRLSINRSCVNKCQNCNYEHLYELSAHLFILPHEAEFCEFGFPVLCISLSLWSHVANGIQYGIKKYMLTNGCPGVWPSRMQCLIIWGTVDRKSETWMMIMALSWVSCESPKGLGKVFFISRSRMFFHT